MHSTCVVAVLTLFVGLARCFSWDIVVAGQKQLHFYYNGNLTHTEEFPLVNRITSVTYDPVQNRVLFSDVINRSWSLYSFDVATSKKQSLLTNISYHTDVRVVYDPVLKLLVWRDKSSLYTFSLNSENYNQAVVGNLLLTLDRKCRDVAIDSCGGYIYWITDNEIERARLDGSEREVVCVVDSGITYQPSLAIDQQTQRVYWIDRKIVNGGDHQDSIKSSDFNGKNQATLYSVQKGSYAGSLATSKDFVYWQHYYEMGTWQLPKNPSDHVAKKLETISSLSSTSYQLVAANYSIQEQIQGIKSCEALRSLIPNNSKPESSICQNYCLEGNCSVNAEGQPTCSCKAGYSGKRCEINACHKHCLHNGACYVNEEDEPVCQCTAHYDGERCETSIRSDASNSEERKVNACHQYCLHNGVCSVNEQDEPACQCTADYDGKRCETSIRSGASNSGERKVNACHQYCLHNGVCSMNEQDEPACQCTADYEGERCEVSVNKDFNYQAACSVSAEGQPKVTITLSTAVKTTCASNVV